MTATTKGVSDATDFVGRAVNGRDEDYLGRPLAPTGPA